MIGRREPPGFSWLIENKLAGMALPYDAGRTARQLERLGVGGVVSLTPRPFPNRFLEERGIDHLHLPVPNFEPPTQEQIRRFMEFCDSPTRRGRTVVVHGLAGKGRTGTMLACYLVVTWWLTGGGCCYMLLVAGGLLVACW